MPYPAPTSEQLKRFNDDGFLVVENAIDPQELDTLVRMGHEMIERPLDPKAKDWDWRRGLLMHQEMEFWYEQFLGKPPSIGAPTPWHQDEAYWGRTLRDRGVTCWTAFHSVGPENGCMHFVRGGHKRLLQHRNPPEMASDLLVCELPKDAEVVVCPIEAGSVTFHHSKTPHMTTGNSSDRWRLVLTQHFRNPACKGLPEDHYSWRVKVNQRTSEPVTDPSR